MPNFISVHNANYLRTQVLTHKQKVLGLYKKALQEMQSYYYPHREEYLYQVALMRERFEQNKDIKDMRIAKKILQEGEEELWQEGHPQPLRYPYSPGGICFERYLDYPDWHMDMWHPYEKAQYPHYFAKREQRKIEFVKLWESQYGKPAHQDAGASHWQEYEVEPKTDEQKKYGPFTTLTPGAKEDHHH